MPKEIPVRATFSGLKFMPKIFTVSNNSVFPLFIIQENSIIHRVFLKKEKSIQNIQEITIFRCWKTENIIISFNDSLFTFIANCQTEEDLYGALVFFQKHGVLLSQQAVDYISIKKISSDTLLYTK